MISALSVDGICYAIKLLEVDKLLLCLRHGILMLGSESVLSKALAPSLSAFRKAIVCLSKRSALWLARRPRFDYIYYLKTKASSLSLKRAKSLLYVISSSLLFYLGCASLGALASGALYTRYSSKSLCYAEARFIKKIMRKIGLFWRSALKSRHIVVFATLFGVCLFVLNIRANKLLRNHSTLKLGASLRFITEACNAFELNARTLLFNAWSLRALSLNAISAFSPARVCVKL